MKQLAPQPVTFRPAAFSAAILILALLLGLAGCAAGVGWNPPEIGNSSTDAAASRADTQLYRCDEGVRFTAVANEESAVLDGDWGKATLLRDAGGQGQSRVYSNRNLRVELGLGPDGRTAELHELTGLDSSRSPMHLSCRRE